MSQLLAIVLERQNYVEAPSAHYPWKWRLTNHDIHHVLTPWQYFHVSTMSEWLRQVAGWKIRPSLSGQSLVLGCRRRETDPPFPIHGKWAQQLKSDDLLVSRGQSDRVERAAPALRLLPALPSCLLQNVWKAFIYKHLPPLPLPKSIISKPETKAGARIPYPCLKLPPGKTPENKLFTREVWQVKFHAFHEGFVHLNPTSTTDIKWAFASLQPLWQLLHQKTSPACCHLPVHQMGPRHYPQSGTASPSVKDTQQIHYIMDFRMWTN